MLIKKFVLGLIILTILVGTANHLLFNYNYVAGSNEKYTSLESLDAMLKDDELPQRVGWVSVGEALVPGSFVASNSTLDEYTFDFISFDIAYKNSHIMIDFSHPEESHGQFHYSTDYYPEKYQALSAAVKTAEKIFFTHTHWDHFNGALEAETANKLYLSRAQLNSNFISAEARENIVDSNVFEIEAAKKVAPGVLAISIAGHTAGSLLFYIKTDDARYLVVGDQAYSNENIVENKGRSLLFSLFSLDSSEMRAGQGRAIKLARDLRQQGVIVLFSHDKDYMESISRPMKDGWYIHL